MDTALLFRDGVSMAFLREWLGEPLPRGSHAGDEVAPAAGVHDQTRLDDATGETVIWDCLRYEGTFREIHEAIARAPQGAHGFVTAALAAASEVHLLSQCSARCVGEDRWILERQCLNHLWQT